MANCKLCVEFDDCPWRSDPDTMCSAFKRKPITNADRIRSMTDEELARMLAIGCHETRECPTICDPIYPYDEVVESCEECWLDWLREEASND